MAVEYRLRAGLRFTDLWVPAAGDVRLHLRHLAGAASPSFLLVHGIGSNARVWDEVADHLARAGHPVYAVDLRGHGESQEPTDGYGTGAAAADLAAVGAALQLSGAIVAGHSWGGNIALRLASAHSEMVAGLALVDGGWIDVTTAVRSWEECTAVAAMLRGPAPAPKVGIDPMRAYLRASHPGWSSTAIEASLADMRVEPDGTLTMRPAEPQFMSIIRSLWDDPPTRDYPCVTVPVLMLPAAHSSNLDMAALVRTWVAAAMAAMPQATTKWYPDGEHYLQAQHPGQLALDLLDLARAGHPPTAA